MIPNKVRRQALVKVKGETFAVTIPSFCLVPFKEIHNSQAYLESILDVVSCFHCKYHKRECVQWKEKLEYESID